MFPSLTWKVKIQNINTLKFEQNGCHLAEANIIPQFNMNPADKLCPFGEQNDTTMTVNQYKFIHTSKQGSKQFWSEIQNDILTSKTTTISSNFDSSSYNISLTHWGRATHICISKLIIIGSDNGLSPGRRQAIIWTNVGILLIGPLGTNFHEILIKISTFSLKQTHFKKSSGKWRPFCLGLNVLHYIRKHTHIWCFASFYCD